MFKGTTTALITPFTNDKVDFEKLEQLIEFQIQNHIDGLLICGTTGEPATMTYSEREEVIKFAIKKINHRIPVMVGTGSNCTRIAIDNTINAEKFGADAALVVTPYYNKCTQNGLIEHYNAIANRTSLPILVYNVPGRTGVNILPETAAKLAENKSLIGLKEACGKLDQIEKTAKAIQGSQLKLYSGDDGLAIDIMKLGANGLISVASNIIPQQTHDMIQSFIDGNTTYSQSIFDKYKELFSTLFVEVNPIPVKYAAFKLGLCNNELRLPLTPIENKNAQIVDRVLKELKII